jgi:EAL domain-containing protein (putative c-di-GMP-specific phosphodiesterase class I)
MEPSGAGIVQPDDVPLLEESGAIVEVGRWVLTEAPQAGALHAPPDRPRASTSPRQPNTAACSATSAARSPRHLPEMLMVEITRRYDHAQRMHCSPPAQSERAGRPIAIDDFDRILVARI